MGESAGRRLSGHRELVSSSVGDDPAARSFLAANYRRGRPYMNAKVQLFQLQLSQYQHDQKYHKDIWLLSVHGRLNHFALHFCKYTGYLAEIIGEPNPSKFQRLVTDSFIVCLAAANTLNMQIAEELINHDINTADNLNDLASRLAKTSNANFSDHSVFLKHVAVEAGRLAKACESIDHLERYPSREVIAETVVDLFKTFLMAAHCNGMDIAREAKSRLLEVEKKHIFHGYL